MVYQRKLQVPISEELNKKLLARTKKAGFSSINEVTRLLLTSFAEGNLEFGFHHKVPQNIPTGKFNSKEFPYSEKELIKLVKDARKQAKAGKLKELDMSKPLHEQLITMDEEDCV
jgi:hypothetical protein